MILWRRLDAPGHDACRVVERDSGWRVEGTALFRDGRGPSCLGYRLDCDREWRTQEGLVQGWIGDRPVEYRVVRTPGGWTLNSEPVAGLNDCVHLDYGFTPATNLSQLRRAALEAGQGTNVPVAWLDVAAGTLDLLDQRYERRSTHTYWYEAPRFEYGATLVVRADGFVTDYPTLWEAER